MLVDKTVGSQCTQLEPRSNSRAVTGNQGKGAQNSQRDPRMGWQQGNIPQWSSASMVGGKEEEMGSLHQPRTVCLPHAMTYSLFWFLPGTTSNLMDVSPIPWFLRKKQRQQVASAEEEETATSRKLRALSQCQPFPQNCFSAGG